MKINSDTYYHIYNRGNNKELIFFEEDNYMFFLSQFKKFASPHCTVYAYCLMPNHFHFFLRINDHDAFDKGIKNFFISYSKAINKKYSRVGTLFQGRYKASEITTNSYYTTIVAYIHQNPVVAGIVKEIAKYKYSSYSAYLSDKPTVVEKNEVLEWFGGLQAFIDLHTTLLDDKMINRYFEGEV